jgi:hypothetical protein
MKVLRVLAAVFVLAMVAGVYAQVINDEYYIPKTTVAPVIDGVLDDIWTSVDEIPQNYMCTGDVSDGWADIWGFSRAMWDDQNLYLFLRTTDDINWQANANSYENDSWEIYFDGDNSKGTAYDNVNDMQLRIETPKDVTAADMDGQSYWVRTGTEFVTKMADDGTGNCTLEIKFPLAGLFIDNTVGTEFGFRLQQNDADGGTTLREARTKWWFGDETDVSWNNPSKFGTAMLWGRELVPNEADFHKVATAPVIDGVMDDVWKDQPVFSQNSHCNGDVFDDDHDISGHYQAIWDDNNLYMLFTTVDDINWQANANSYENDSWEIYFDGDNSKGTAYDNVNDMQLRIETPKDVTAADMDGQSYWVRTGTEFATKMADDGTGDLVCEVKFPLAGIFVDPTVDTEFGFQAQQNDADGGTTLREARTKWWADAADVAWNNPSVFGTAVLKGVITAVKETPGVAKNFALSQNYPNPFNPTTNIDFSVTNRGAVKLSVYDLMGRQVATVVNEVKNAGKYTATFDASKMASGVYFYKLETAGNVMTKKMMVLK